MAEKELFKITTPFSNQVSRGVVTLASPTRVHIKVDSGPRFANFVVFLVIGNSPNGVKATDGLTSQPAWTPVDNDGKPHDFKWSVPAGTYTLVLQLSTDHRNPNAKVDATVTVLLDPPGKTYTIHAPPKGTTSDPYGSNPNPNPGNVLGSPGIGAGGSGIGSPAGQGGSGTGTGSGTGSGAGLGGGSQHLGAENPGGAGNTLGPGAGAPSAGPGTTSSDPNASPTEQSGPPVDKAGNPESGPPLGGPPGDPGGPGPSTGGPQPGDPGDPGGPQPGDPGGGGPSPTEKGGGGPQPGDPGSGGPTPGGPQPGGDPGGGGPPPADPKTGGGGPPPADPNGPPPGNPEGGGGGGDPPPPPPAPEFPPDWVMDVSAVLGAARAAQVGAILGSTQGHSAPEAALGAGVALGAAISGLLAAIGTAGVGAMHVEAHVGPLQGHERASRGSGAAHLAFLYVPHGAPARSIRFREPGSGAAQVIEAHPDALLVFHSALVAEAVGEKHLPLVQGRVSLLES